MLSLWHWWRLNSWHSLFTTPWLPWEVQVDPWGSEEVEDCYLRPGTPCCDLELQGEYLSASLHYPCFIAWPAEPCWPLPGE